MTKFWQNCWQNGRTPWDLGGRHPLLPELWKLLLQYFPGRQFQRAMVPGCGKGHDAAWLGSYVSELVVSDIVPEAVDEARGLYGQNINLSFLVHDALVPQCIPKLHDLIYDRAMLCALPEKLRKKYVQACYESLAPSGVFMGIIFSEVTCKGGPPFAVSVVELMQLFPEPFWSPIFMGERQDGACNEVIVMENLVAFIKV